MIGSRRFSVPAFFQLGVLSTVLLAASPSYAGSWGALNKDYGGGLSMKLYTPTTPAPSPAVLVAIHFCTGNADSSKSWFTSDADKSGFYIIAPDAGANCFDASATRAGDRADIVKMVEYVITQKNADKNRVFAAGFSSGGCMTNTLLAIYPDVFAGGSAMPGFPVGVWPAGDHTCSQCSTANPPTLQTKTAQQWGDVARTAFAFTGTRPCVQEWAGDNDMYPFNEYMPAVASQFSNLMDLDAGSPGSGAPSGWTRTVYKDKAGNVRLEMNIGAGKPHDLTGSNLFGSVITFLGLDKSTGACGLTGGSGGSGAGGTSSTGGASAGGAPPATGGTTTAGGSAGALASNGGSAPTSGSAGTATSSGGAPTAAGGAPSVAGSASVAGSPSNAGSSPAAGGATAGSPSGSAASDSGCSCSTVGTLSSRSSLAAMLALSALYVASARRRRNRTRDAR